MEWQKMFVGPASALVRTAVVGVLAYLSLIALLRVTGKRTLSKFNAFDFVVTVALGSTLASVLTSKDVSLLQGVIALALLLGLQFAITWMSVRSERVQELVKSEPQLILVRGEPLHGALKRERVTLEELHAAARNSGLGTLEDVAAAILETDGSITIVEDRPDGRAAALHKVRGWAERAGGEQRGAAGAG